MSLTYIVHLVDKDNKILKNKFQVPLQKKSKSFPMWKEAYFMIFLGTTLCFTSSKIFLAVKQAVSKYDRTAT